MQPVGPCRAASKLFQSASSASTVPGEGVECHRGQLDADGFGIQCSRDPFERSALKAVLSMGVFPKDQPLLGG